MAVWRDGRMGGWAPEEFEEDVFFEHVDPHGGDVRFLQSFLSIETKDGGIHRLKGGE